MVVFADMALSADCEVLPSRSHILDALFVQLGSADYLDEEGKSLGLKTFDPIMLFQNMRSGLVRPKMRWSDCFIEDMKDKNLEGTDTRDRRQWRMVTMNVNPT